jgi:CDP-glucose 4,6-dehydratase
MTTSTAQPFHGIYRGKKVLVTGHTGFKGSWLTRWLLDLGAVVAGYARDPLPHETLFDAMGLGPLLERDVRGDLADLDALSALVAEFQPEFIFHLAAQPLVRLSYDIPVETFATNVMGTVNVLEALRQYAAPLKGGEVEGLNGKSFQPLSDSTLQPPRPVVAVMITTDKCYENKEWLSSYREDDAMGGYDPYSASKGCAELVIASYRRSFFENGAGEQPVRIASARAGNVIGGGDWATDRIVPDCFRAIHAGDSIPVRNKIATRPWQHVLEPLSGYLWLGAILADPSLLRFPDTKPFRSGFNFGPNLTSNRTVAQLVEELLKHACGQWEDRSDPNAPHEASKLNLAIDKAFHLLGWQPVWDFETTIAQTAGWYVRERAGETAAALCDEHIAAYAAAAHAKGLPWAGTS